MSLIEIRRPGINESLLRPLGKCWPAELNNEEIEVNSSCLFDDVEEAVTQCVKAQKEFAGVSLEERKQIVADIRAVCLKLANDFAFCAYSETQRGNYHDKVQKQILSASKTPGPEDLIPTVTCGDKGMTVTSYSPYGVLAAVTPVTNPTATVINNAIIMISSGNGIIFNAHPSAKRCTNRVIAIINELIKNRGGPSSLICGMREPTVQSGQALLTHPKLAANLVTGGPAVVKVALSSGKKSFCAGPGNPPVVVDETAILDRAAAAIYKGASFDNNMICSDEKEVFVVDSVADQLLDELMKCGAYVAPNKEIVQKLESLVLKAEPDGRQPTPVKPELVGKSPQLLMREIGLELNPECRLIICDVDKEHTFVWSELLMPILAIVRCKNFDEALLLAKAAEHGNRHTASIYSQNLDRVTQMAKTMDTAVFCINGNHIAGLGSGGEGHTSFSITGFTGEGMTRPRTFVRERRYVIVGSMSFGIS